MSEVERREILLEIPLTEFEFLHAEVKRLKGENEVLALANQTFVGTFEELARVTKDNEKLRAQCLYPMHMCIGDSAATMRMLCGQPISDACWTRNPRLVTCERCEGGVLTLLEE